MNLELIPLRGVELNGRAVHLGDHAQAVRGVLGEPDSVVKHSWYYFDGELRIDFDGEGAVEFIECLGGVDGRLHPRVWGVDAFRAHADRVKQLLEQYNAGTVLDRENGYSYAFANIGVGVYRESVPENVVEYIQEARANGMEPGEEELEEERKRAFHWAAIGIGREDYYKES